MLPSDARGHLGSLSNSTFGVPEWRIDTQINRSLRHHSTANHSTAVNRPLTSRHVVIKDTSKKATLYKTAQQEHGKDKPDCV